jgi:hypothetical protein
MGFIEIVSGNKYRYWRMLLARRRDILQSII